jgi:hypothetical protein
MDYHIDRKVVLSEESEFKNLYKWSLQELDENGKQIGRNLVPWSWSLNFTVTMAAGVSDMMWPLENLVDKPIY